MAMPMTSRGPRTRELVTHGLQIAHNDNLGSFPTLRIVMSLPQLLQLTDLIILIILFTYNSKNHRAFLSNEKSIYYNDFCIKI